MDARCRSMLALCCVSCAAAKEGARCNPAIKSAARSTSIRVTLVSLARARTISETMMPGIVSDEPGPATTTRDRFSRPDPVVSSSRRQNTISPQSFRHDYTQDPESVMECAEVTVSTDPSCFKAGYLACAKSAARRANSYQRLNLEAVG